MHKEPSINDFIIFFNTLNKKSIVHNSNKVVVALKMKGSKSQEKLLTSFMNNPDIK